MELFVEVNKFHLKKKSHDQNFGTTDMTSAIFMDTYIDGHNVIYYFD